MLRQVPGGILERLLAMSCRPRWKAGVLRATLEVPGSSPIQVYSSAGEEESGDIATPMQESRDGQQLAWSQGTPNCRGTADVMHSGQEEDEMRSDVKRRLWKEVSTHQAASHVRSPLQNAHTAIEAWSQVSPVLNKCRLLAPDLHGKTIRVLLPCGGIDAPGWAARALGIEFDVVGYYDTDPQYEAYMINVGVDPSRVHVGMERGDFSGLALSHVPRCNLLVAGPPCPPFSRSGKHHGFEDHRAHVFFHIIAVIGHCASTQPEFSCFVIENVAGMMDVLGGKQKHPCRQSPMDQVVHELYQRLGRSEWMVRVHRLDAKDFGLPQSRPRVYITGIRRSRVVGNVSALRPEQFRMAMRSLEPSAVPDTEGGLAASHGMPNLADLMDKSLPPASRHALTDQQKTTIQDNKDALQKAMDDTGNRGRVAVCALSRSRGAKWGLQNRSDGLCRCLTTNNNDLYVFSLGEGHANPALSYDRFLTVNERCLLQGFPPLSVLTALGLPEKHAVHATGNAMAVPVIGAVMTSVLHGVEPQGFEQRLEPVLPTVQ